jgi:alanyl-tRNA synthetase
MTNHTVKKYWDDPFVFSFTTSVVRVVDEPNRTGLVFEETYFYPEGGGQPCDRGKIDSHPVVDIQKVDGEIIHYIQKVSDKELNQGSTVSCEIDKDYRIHNMRLHTAGHLLFGAARRLYPKVEYAGFNIGKVGNLYLNTDQQIRSDDLHKMSLMANLYVVENHPIKAYLVKQDEVNNIAGLAVNLELPEGDVRIIDIEGWDVAACSGTHVQRSVDIGPIKVLAREVHKKNVTRIDYAVGELAISEMAADEKIISETSEFLSTSKDQLNKVVQKMSNELRNANKELKKMQERLVEYKFHELNEGGEVINGIRVVIEKLDYLDSNSVKILVTKLLNQSHATIVAIVGGGEQASIVAGCSQDVQLPVSETIINIAKRYGGGGGGKLTFVSTGGIKADTEKLISVVDAELRQLIG